MKERTIVIALKNKLKLSSYAKKHYRKQNSYYSRKIIALEKSTSVFHLKFRKSIKTLCNTLKHLEHRYLDTRGYKEKDLHLPVQRSNLEEHVRERLGSANLNILLFENGEVATFLAN